MAANTIESGRVAVDGKLITKPGKKIAETSTVDIKKGLQEQAPEIRLEIIYEDDDCVVIDKPAGVLVHSKGVFSPENTVASWLLPKTDGFEENNNRAGIVHRLDRGTSGIMICAKNPKSLGFLQKQFSTRKVKKTYNALIEGEITPPEAIIDVPVERNPKDPKRFRAGSNGKPAQTRFKAVKKFFDDDREYSLLELVPKTGRTHQLRVHLLHLKHPIVGDDFYGGIKADRLYLHAVGLELTLPGGERRKFESALPAEFTKPKILKDG